MQEPLPASSRSRKLMAWLNVLGTFAALLVIFAFFAIKSPGFRTMGNVETLARQASTVAIAAMGMTLIIMSGGIDLSVGSAIALVTVVTAMTLKAGYNAYVGAAVGILTGAACGALNGLLTTSLRVVPFIITLGTLGIYRGMATGIAEDQRVSASSRALFSLIAPLRSQEQWKLFPPGIWLMFLLVFATAMLLRYTRFGRHAVAVGSNEQTARLCGIPVQRVKVLVYTIAGVLAGVAGLMQYSYLHVGDPTTASGLELNIIAAVVIGGGSLAGGEGSALGTLIGAAIMTTIAAGGGQLSWPNWLQQIITGVIIIVAVAVDRLRHRKALASQEG
jgi:ribose transport system permease protein